MPDRACRARSKVKGATQRYNAGDIHSLAFRQAAADAYNRICKIRSAIANLDAQLAVVE